MSTATHEIDPLAQVVLSGGYPSDYPEWNDETVGILVPDRLRRCEAPDEGGTGYICTRIHGHPAHWAHVACRRDRVLGIWGGAAPPPVPEIEVPEDGSPVDTDPVLETAPAVGAILKLRDRENRLYVIGGVAPRRADGRIEVLDLIAREYRTFSLGRLIPRPEESLTQEQFAWVTQWFVGQRDRTRTVAVREYRAGRWCMEGLNESLKELKMRPYEPRLGGNIQITIPFDTTTDGRRSQIEAAVREALTRADFREHLPPIDVQGIEIDRGLINVRATDFTRR